MTLRLVAIAPCLEKAYRRTLLQQLYLYKTNCHCNQFGCRKHFQAADAFATLRAIAQLVKKHQKPLYIVRVDVAKAFDSTAHHGGLEALLDTGALGWLVHAILKSYLYAELEAVLPHNNVQAATVQNRGVRQGLFDSGFLYVLAVDFAFKGQVKM